MLIGVTASRLVTDGSIDGVIIVMDEQTEAGPPGDGQPTGRAEAASETS